MAWRPPVANMVRQGASIPIEGNQGQAGSSDANQNRPNPSPIPAEIFDPNDQTNPLHIHANESPTLQLVTFQLEGMSNYHSWARAMEMALRSKNKMSFVSGRVAVPNELDPKYYYWERCNTMVLSWIMRALSPTIARGVLWINTAEGVWKDLKKRFSQQDVIRIAEIRSQIHQTRQGFANGVKGYKLLDVQTKEVFLSRDVSFYEDTFPYQHSQDKQPSNLVLPSEGMSCLTYDEAIPLPTHEALPDLLEIPAVTPVQNNEPVDTEASPPPEPRRSTRVRTKPAYLDDYTCQSTIKRTSPHDISKFMSYESLSQAYKEVATQKQQTQPELGDSNAWYEAAGGLKKGGYVFGFGSDTPHYFPDVVRQKNLKSGQSSSHVVCDEKIDKLNGEIEWLKYEIMAIRAANQQSSQCTNPTGSHESSGVGLDDLEINDGTESPMQE
nr:uncharacterized protein LOC109157049 [Ipomoea batatas]